MPDWTYQPILRPLLFRLAPTLARDLVLHTSAALAEMPWGTQIIDLMGRMMPPQEARCSFLGLEFPASVGLSNQIDRDAYATRAFSRFGFGFIEVGPVTLAPTPGSEYLTRDVGTKSIHYRDVPINNGVDHLKARLLRLRQRSRLSTPIGIRIAYKPGSDPLAAGQERAELLQQLAPVADFFILECQSEISEGRWSRTEWEQHLTCLKTLDPVIRSRLMLDLRPDMEWTWVQQIVQNAWSIGIRGISISGGIAASDSNETGYRVLGPAAQLPGLRLLQNLRQAFGEQLVIIASGGIQEPADAITFLQAGADLIQIDCGFVYSGPGLPKRINEAVTYFRPQPDRSPEKRVSRARIFANIPDWIWFLLLGLGLSCSAIVVWIVALSRTVLPYDESFVGLSRAQLMAVNPRLLAFMTHDRVSVSSTMLSTGILYSALAWYGVRHGYQWARQVILTSAITGFLSFFLFLGYGYFDPLHASLTLGLLPLFILGVWAPSPRFEAIAHPNLTNNWRWKRALKGQLFFVLVGVGLLVGGLTISGVGVTQVFVPEDLSFMNTTAEVLRSASTRLVPLIAHDRTGFGGNLVSVGLAVLLTSLWGFRQGERWIWWALAGSGLPGFLGALGVHLAVGYVDLWHLFPVILALLYYIVGLTWTYPFFHNSDPKRLNTAAVGTERTATLQKV